MQRSPLPVPRLARLLAFGKGPAAELRGWYRWLLWRRATTRLGQIKNVWTLVSLPLRALTEAVGPLRQLGGGVAHHRGVSVPRQLLQLWWLRTRYGLMPDAYYSYQLFKPDRHVRASQYIQNHEVGRIFTVLNWHEPTGFADVLSDKRTFERFCASHGIPGSVP